MDFLSVKEWESWYTVDDWISEMGSDRRSPREHGIGRENVDKSALSVDIWFRTKAVVPHSVHFRFRRAAVGKFGGCRK